jgi:hypothetical protein
MHVSEPRPMRHMLVLLISGLTLGTLGMPDWMVGYGSLVGVLEVSAQKVQC